MTPHPKNVSILLIAASAVFGALLAAACGAPVPTADENPGAPVDRAPAVTTGDAPPATRGPTARRLTAAWPADPEFTAMTVRPSLQNATEVREALVREYPALLRDAGIGGAPLLWIHIDQLGVVDEVRVHESSGYEALDQAALQVAMVMRFSPAYNGEQVVRAWVQIPIRFAAVS